MHLIFLWGLIFTVKMFFGILKTSAILYLSLLHAQRVCSQTAGWGWVGRIEGMKSCYPGNMTNIPSYAKFPLQFHFLTAPYNKTFIPILLYLCAMMQNNSGGEHTWRESLASSMFWGPMQKICKVKDLRTIDVSFGFEIAHWYFLDQVQFQLAPLQCTRLNSGCSLCCLMKLHKTRFIYLFIKKDPSCSKP